MEDLEEENHCRGAVGGRGGASAEEDGGEGEAETEARGAGDEHGAVADTVHGLCESAWFASTMRG